MVPKSKLHPRNQHAQGYDFVRLVAQTPELDAFTISNPLGQTTIENAGGILHHVSGEIVLSQMG